MRLRGCFRETPKGATPMSKKKTVTSTRNRCAKTGQFVTPSYTNNNPTTTVTEKRKPYKK